MQMQMQMLLHIQVLTRVSVRASLAPIRAQRPVLLIRVFQHLSFTSLAFSCIPAERHYRMAILPDSESDNHFDKRLIRYLTAILTLRRNDNARNRRHELGKPAK